MLALFPQLLHKSLKFKEASLRGQSHAELQQQLLTQF